MRWLAMPLTMPITMEPRNAPSQFTSKAPDSSPTSQNMTALMTKAKRPNVAQESGSVRNVAIGRIRAFTIAMMTTALVTLGGVSVAQAGSLGRPCTEAPEDQWLSLDALKARAEAQGYTVKKVKLKAACGEIYALDRSGARTELFVDPTSGRIVAKE